MSGRLDSGCMNGWWCEMFRTGTISGFKKLNVMMSKTQMFQRKHVLQHDLIYIYIYVCLWCFVKDHNFVLGRLATSITKQPRDSIPRRGCLVFCRATAECRDMDGLTIASDRPSQHAGVFRYFLDMGMGSYPPGN